MESPLGPTIANVLSFLEVEWLQQCPREFKPVFTKISWWHLILVIQTCLLFWTRKKNGQLSFLDIEASREKGKLVTTCKRTFSGVHTHFESFLPTVYKFSMFYTLAYCFKICSDWTKFYKEVSFWKQVFLKNIGTPLSFIDNPGEIFLQTGTKFEKSLKDLLNFCKLQIPFKSQRKLRCFPFLRSHLRKLNHQRKVQCVTIF